MSFQVSLDTNLKCHGARRATNACAVETNLNDAIGCDIHELKVAAVGLDGWPDQVDHLGDLFADGIGWFVGGCSHAV